MIIAVTYENGMVFQHFGHTAQFKLYTVENNAIKESRLLPTGASGHGALAGLLESAGVNMLICGGIGAGAKDALAKCGITIFPGVTGNADQSVQALFSGTLHFVPDVLCSHHHENGHSCGEDKHGCGGNH